jgi:hypothetical protein
MPGASVLEIDCESAAKAKIVLAKYVSDLNCLPGVSDAVLPSLPTVAAHVVAAQGAVTAVRMGNKVDILTASNLIGLLAVFKAAVPAKGAVVVSKPETAVPMYLDRWDKFGFRFYYRPWEQPPGQPASETYDVNHEFEWAKTNGRTGLLFWADMCPLETAEGMTHEAWWDWAEKAAKKYELPTAINDTWGINVNGHRDQQMTKMPEFLGSRESVGIADNGTLSWNATTAADEELGLVQTTIKDFDDDQNVVSWLEPIGELYANDSTVLDEYGPVADGGYRRYLKATFGSLTQVSKRWYGDAGHLRSWDDIRVPEVASFLGWGPRAIDLTGTWRVGYEPFTGATPSNYELQTLGNRRVEGTTPAPDSWYSSTFDDSSWPTLEAPGNDAMLFLPHRPAVFRRHFDVSEDWRGANPKAWLYVWDLTLGTGDTVRVWLNDVELPRSTVLFNTEHWCALDVSSVLKPGSNFLAMRMPKGVIGYRVYISPDPPIQYPNLGANRNAQWVDFANWQQWFMGNMVERAMEMIRQVDPNRNITQMHPDPYVGVVKDLCMKYGAEFHNTGYMGAFYADMNPLLMNGSDMPNSVEPGGPPKNLAEYKHMMGLYYSEGVQSVDYFIHIGNVLWNDDMRSYFEKTQNSVHLFGKYHAPKAKVAVLYSFKADVANTFPWGSDPNGNLAAGYWRWNLGANLEGRCDRDGVTDGDFGNGNAAAYKVIVDSNTSVMDGNLVSQIEKYVRNGGVFVTFAQTGRHTPTEPDAWPIERLTGYKVTHIDNLDSGGNPVETRSLRAVPGQAVFDPTALAELNAVPANGLSLQAQSADTHDLLLWADGAVAAGYRQIGKGAIVQIGCKWTGNGISDRIEPGGDTAQEKALTALLSKLMDWQGIPRVPGRLAPENDWMLTRHYVSNNGLYDVWTLWNESPTQPQTATFEIDGAKSLAYDVDTSKPVSLIPTPTGVQLENITLDPGQTRIFLTSRGQLATAPLDWLTLQRHWWRGTTKPPATPLPMPAHKFNMDLGQDWQWRALTERDDAEQIAKLPGNAGWETMRLGVWTVPDHVGVQHGLFRRSFTVPARFAGGLVSLWLHSQWNTTFVNRGRVWLDGALLSDWGNNGIAGDDFGGALKPGSTHELAVEIEGTGSLAGSRGTCWLAWKPAPTASLDLAGAWAQSNNLLKYDAESTLPGPYNAMSLRRTVAIPGAFAAHNVVFAVHDRGPVTGVLVNGHWVGRATTSGDTQWSLDVTPWIHAGTLNSFEMLSSNGPGKGNIMSVALESYPPGGYPSE